MITLLLCLLLLLSTLRPLTQALPPSPLTAATCTFAPSRHLAQCDSLLAKLLAEPWVQIPTTFGPTEEPPGYTPKYRDTYHCQFLLGTKVLGDWGTETIRLADWKEEILVIERECLNSGRGNVATVDVGVKGVFYVRLSGRTVVMNGTVGNSGAAVEA